MAPSSMDSLSMRFTISSREEKKWPATWLEIVNLIDRESIELGTMHCSISSCLPAASSSALLSSHSALRSSTSMKVLNPRLRVLKPGLAGVEKIGGSDIPPGVAKLEAAEV